MTRTPHIKARLEGNSRESIGADQDLKRFIGKFDPEHQALRKRLPTAIELVYDNYNCFVIGYSSTERPSDSILSIAEAAIGVGLCFIHGAGLPDLGKILLGSGRQTRFIRLGSADEARSPGSHYIHFNGAGLAGGVYVYQLHAGSFAETRKLVLVK